MLKLNESEKKKKTRTIVLDCLEVVGGTEVGFWVR